jgi:uridine kinase
MSATTPTRMVAIVGGSGSGKSWLAGRLAGLLQSGRLSQDDFYRDRSHLTPGRRATLNFDHPNAIDWPLLEEVLNTCKAGQAYAQPRYDFTTHTRRGRSTKQPARSLMVIDGLWLLQRPSVRRLFDLSIFLDCSARIRLQRREARDTAERGRARAKVRQQFRTTVAPMHRRYVQPQCRWATLVMRQPYRAAEVTQLADHCWELLNAGGRRPAQRRGTFHAEMQALINQNAPSL